MPFCTNSESKIGTLKLLRLRDTLTLGGSLDIHFETLNLAFDENLFFAPIGDQPKAILDVGTGTGEISSSSCHQEASEY